MPNGPQSNYPERDNPQTPRREPSDQLQHGGMGERGVTRPMDMMSHGDQGRSESDGKSGGSDHQQGKSEQSEHDAHGGHGMSDEHRKRMLRMHHKKTLWIYWSLIMLGLWLLTSPFTFGYLNEDLWVDPSGGRGVWFSERTHTALRAQLMVASDMLSGLVLLVLGWRSLSSNRPASLWGCCFVGVWLTLAPVLFWAPTASAYLNDTLVGGWIIGLTILIPGMPNMIMYMQMGGDLPPGWSYNPSSWPQRWIMIVGGLVGWLVSRYLAVFQLGYVDYVWDPFFGFAEGTKKVLDSNMSHMWPISDAGLGGITYTFEFLMGFMGSSSRWRTMPWMVAFFGILVIPLGLTHVILVISQPVVVHEWCTMCLLAAAIMLPMIPLEVDEVVAMIQHVRQAYRRGDRGGSLWAIFWKGGSAEGCNSDKRSPELATFPQQPGKVFLASIWGMSFPWTLIAATFVGAALMFTPNLFGIEIKTRAADIGHLGGALIITVSVVAMGEVVRIGRYVNGLLGITIAAGVWLTADATTPYAAVATILGLAAIGLSIPRGRVLDRFGSWDRYIK